MMQPSEVIHRLQRMQTLCAAVEAGYKQRLTDMEETENF